MDRLVNNPNFFIVGAPKSATTNISYYLMQHSEIFMPKELEPYYFARNDISRIIHEKSFLLRKNTLTFLKIK